MSSEEKLQALVGQLRAIESYLSDIDTKNSLSIRASAEARASLEAVKTLTSSNVSDVLIPLGGGISIQSSVSKPKRLLVNVGAGITMEKRPDEAITLVEERIKDLETAIESLSSQRNDLTNQYDAMRATINNLVENKG